MFVGGGEYCVEGRCKPFVVASLGMGNDALDEN